MNFYLGDLKTLVENLTSSKAPSPLATGWWCMIFAQNAAGVPVESQALFNQPRDGCPAQSHCHVYIKGATKQKFEIQRNLTNTVLSPWIKFIASRTRADVSAIQVNAIVATPTVINQAFVDI